jgi:hypothetical protein
MWQLGVGGLGVQDSSLARSVVTATTTATAEAAPAMASAVTTAMPSAVMMASVPAAVTADDVAIDSPGARIAARLDEHYEPEQHGYRDGKNERPRAHSPSVAPDILVRGDNDSGGTPHSIRRDADENAQSPGGRDPAPRQRRGSGPQPIVFSGGGSGVR